MLGEQLVVVSDAHIRRDSNVEALMAFLEAVPTLGDCLLINGDLFDFWFAYRRSIPQTGFPIVAALAMLRRRIPIVMTGGNHDRWGDRFWPSQANIAFCPGEARLEVAGRVVVAAHGDGLFENNRVAETTHAVIMHPVTARVFSWLHPDIGLWLVDRFGGHLADATGDPELLRRAEARQIEWATARLAAEPAIGALVLSHTHRPCALAVRPGRHFLNPGAWIEGRRYATVSRDAVALHQFGS